MRTTTSCLRVSRSGWLALALALALRLGRLHPGGGTRTLWHTALHAAEHQ